MWESHFFLLFYGGVELFCDIVKSAVVVGEIVLLPVLVPVLVPVEFVSSARMHCLGRGSSQLETTKDSLDTKLEDECARIGRDVVEKHGDCFARHVGDTIMFAWRFVSTNLGAVLKVELRVEELDSQATQALSEVAKEQDAKHSKNHADWSEAWGSTSTFLDSLGPVSVGLAKGSFVVMRVAQVERVGDLGSATSGRVGSTCE